MIFASKSDIKHKYILPNAKTIGNFKQLVSVDRENKLLLLYKVKLILSRVHFIMIQILEAGLMESGQHYY